MSRLDLALVERGLARSRGQARELLAANQVVLNGRPAAKASLSVTESDVVDVVVRDHYVSRAAHKLTGALDELEVVVTGRALDAGASTGGFTQVLLERGCEQVIAVDVGHDQLAEQLRSDARVVNLEGVNLRDLDLDHVNHRPVDLVVADVSFISLTLLIAPLTSVLRADGDLLLMIKPQFEVGKGRLGKGGVVESPELRSEATAAVVSAAARAGWSAQAVVQSRQEGRNGNVEYFAHFRRN